MLIVFFLCGQTAWAQWAGSGTEADPYQISSTSNWNTLASYVNSGTTYSGKFFKLMADITVTETVSSGTPAYMVGSSDSKSFQGTFDGNGHTLTLDYNDNRTGSDDNYCAPFRYINGATIKSLHVNGTISKTQAKHAGGFVGKALGNNYITNCRSSVDIQFTKSGDVSSGGFIGDVRGSGSTTFTNCLFDGKLRGASATSWGGFVGWVASGRTVTFNNCLFNPSESNYSTSDGKTFARKASDGTVKTNNCYYKASIGDAQGATSATNYSNNQLLSALGVLWETITENNAQKVVPVIGNPFVGEGTEASPYQIANVNDWSLLVAFVKDGVYTYNCKFLKMTNSFTVEETVTSGDPTKMIGISQERSFRGTFDGNGNTMTLDINDTRNADYCAPFRTINGATIKNLHVAGTIIKSHNKHAGGIVGEAYGTNNIVNCRVSATINSALSGDGSHGGFLGDINGGTTTFNGCLFDGQLQGSSTSDWGGFVGWVSSGCTASFIHCMFKPALVNVKTSGCGTFARKYDGNGTTVSITNSYYTQTLGSAQGGQARTLSAGENVSMTPYGTREESSVSDITTYNLGTSYNGCIKYGDVIYSANNNTVQLNLSYTQEIPEHYTAPVYSVTGGTLTGTDSSYTLTMPNSDATINATLAPEDWQGSGTEADPYLIYTDAQWGLLASRVNDGSHSGYNGNHFKLMADITLTETISTGTPTMMVGTSESKSFQGTFDGNAHTITLAYNDTRSADFCAPFRYIKGATIKYLHVAGSIYKSQNKGAAGIVGSAYGTNNIISCRSSVDINFDKSGDVTSGGILADLRGGETHFENCLFDGKLRGGNAHSWGGLVGWVADGPDAYFTNCLFNPTAVSVNNNNSKDFARCSSNSDLHFTNCYRKNSQLSSDQGVNASSYTNAALRTALGNGWEIVTENNAEIVVPIMGVFYTFNGAGTEDSPYEIANATDWSHLAATVNGGHTTYSGKFFKVTADFTVEETITSGEPTLMVGCSETRSFQGTFDSDGHTITLDYIDNRNGSDDDNSGPFQYIKGATIKNLHVSGSLTKTNKKKAGTLVGQAFGINNIVNCRSSVTFTASTKGDGSHGGFIGEIKSGTTNFDNCLFDGQLQGTSTSNWGGFVGWVASGCKANFINCMFKPAQISINNSGCRTFARQYDGNGTTVSFSTNCYYTQSLGGNQGKLAYTINAGDYVTVRFYGTGTNNNPSSVTAYSTSEDGILPGLLVDGVLYAGQNENVKLKLNSTIQVPLHYSGFYYTATNGNDIKNEVSYYTLIMSNSDVTINATLYSAEWEGSGTEADPFLIYTDDQWRLLVSLVNDGNHNGFSGVYFKLMDDITLTETISTGTPTMMIGTNTSDNTKFRGIFDGNGHTITLAFNDTRNAEACAPFLFVKDATIKNLHVKGSIYKTQNKYAAGLVGRAQGTSYIASCRVSVDIQFGANGDVSSGGIVGDLDKGNIHFTDCLFDGKLQGNLAKSWGGFIGWMDGDSKAYFTNCLFNPEFVNVKNEDNKVFARRYESNDLQFSNTYRKNDQLSTDQGVDASSYTNTALRTALGIGWIIVTEDNVEKVVPNVSPHAFAGEGTEASPYLISSFTEWGHLASIVNSGASTFDGKFFKVTADFTVEETVNANNSPNLMVGKSQSRSFQGTFDGDGHTITLNFIDDRNGSEEDNFSGPFRFIDGATIKNLHVTGNLTKTRKKNAGGLVGRVYGICFIENCRSSVILSATSNGDGSHGGFVGDVRDDGNVNFRNCLFDGELQGPSISNWGGFVGWVADGCGANFTNCVFKPTQVSVDTDGCKTFARGYGDCNVFSGYYYQTLGASQGKQVRVINVGDDVSMTPYGTEETTVGGITFYTYSIPTVLDYTQTVYNECFKMDGVVYAGQNDNVKLNLSSTIEIPQHYTDLVYTATNGGSIEGSESPYTLTMPNSDVTINATLVSGDWLGSGTEADPYLIYNDGQWGRLVSRVNAGTYGGYSGKFFKLMADITLTETISMGTPTMMVGANTSDDTKFRGTFDGNGHTITLAFNDTRNAELCAPFLYVKDATIKHLRVDGSIYKTQNKHAAGLVGRAQGTSYIAFCRVSVDIQFVKSGDVSSGGLVADLDNGIIHISNCLFDGKMQGANAKSWGGFIGWVDSGSEAHVTSCLFNPELVNVKNEDNMAFARRDESNDLYFSHIYRKNDNLGTNQGVDASSYTNEELLEALGTGWETVTESNVEKVVPFLNARPFTGDGTIEHPYEIANASQWDQIAANVNSGVTTYSGKHFRQTADFTVEESINSGDPIRMIGTSETNSFQGIYDGDGYTITLNYYDNREGEDYCAPFRFINGAIIKSLHVNGKIEKVKGKYAGGLVGKADGTNAIFDCRSSVHILASAVAPGPHGGFIGELRESGSTTNFSNCLFDGKLQGSNDVDWGGFVGWVASGCTTNFTNCMFKPALLDVDTRGCGTFARIHQDNGHVNFTNSYYTQNLGSAQAKQAYTISAGTDVTVEFYGNGSDNICSGIIDFCGIHHLDGLLVDDVLYAAKDENVMLNLVYIQAIPEHYIPSYTVTDGTLSGSVSPFFLKMPNSNVTINFAKFVTAEWQGSGTEADPYLIYTDAQWMLLADRVNNRNITFSGRFFKLMADITVNEAISSGTPATMVGTSDSNSFQGTFDGNGHTITLNYSDTRNADFCAPFRYINGATIKYLHVNGTIYKTKGKNAGGLVGKAVGTNEIINCRSSVDIHFDKKGDTSSGGFIGELRESGSTTFTNCLFDGKLRGENATSWGGFVGWVASGRTAIFNNCLFNPEESNYNTNGGKTFARMASDGRVATSECYYKAIINDAQGATDASNMTNVALKNGLGSGWKTIMEDAVEKVVPINCANPVMGDVNGDGAISVSDVTLMVDYILGVSNGIFIFENADISGDGTISVADVTLLVNFILGQSN